MKSDVSRIGVVVVTITLTVLFVAVMILNILTNDPKLGVFLATMSNQSATYPTAITPPGFTFSIWGLIYFQQAVFLLYLLVNLFRGPDPPEGAPQRFFSIPGPFPASGLVFYTASYALTVGWLFLFDRATANRVLLGPSAAVLWAVVAVLYIALFLNYWRAGRVGHALSWWLDWWAVKVVVPNGISMYAAWCSVAAPLNTAIALEHQAGLMRTTAGTVALAVVAVEAALYVALDTFLLDKWTRYVITPHLTLVWALGGSLIKNYRAGTANSILTASILAAAGMALLLKIVLMLVRHCRQAAGEGVAYITDPGPAEVKKPVV